MTKGTKLMIALFTILAANTLALIGLGSAYGVTFITVVSGVVITVLSALFVYKVATYFYPRYMADEQDHLDD